MLRLRPYKKCDAASIANWEMDERSYYLWNAGMMDEYPMTEERMNGYTDSIAHEQDVYQVVACDDDKVMGYMTMHFEDAAREVVRFGFIIVNPANRREGIAKQMLALAQKYAFDFLMAKRVRIGVFEENVEAIKCYQSAGFWEIKVDSPKTFKFGEEVWTNMEMEAYPNIAEAYARKRDYPEEKMIREVIEHNSFRYAFQPIIDAATGDVFGYEALMRAEYNGPIPPLTILEKAEKYNRLDDVERATFYNTMQIVSNQAQAFEGKKVFINSIPGHQLPEAEYEELMTSHKEFMEQLVIEVTEGAELPDEDWARLLASSKKNGFAIAIDDYGTGYSNTTNLLKHIPSYVKIDHLLVTDIQDDNKKRHFVKAIVDFAHANGFKALAEGVENSSELRAVIQLGVDLIQGFYTARPSYDILQEIPKEIRQEILHANVSTQTLENRKVYTVREEKELPLMRIALEQYTGILIDTDEFTLVGNPEYRAAMSIKINDNRKCRLVLDNVLMESFQELPCIELGMNTELTLVLVGENSMNRAGICVPDTSKFILEGSGSLSILGQGVHSYAIGNTWNSAVGDITLRNTGFVKITIEADFGIGIGGGTFREGSGVSMESGTWVIIPASANAIGIGCVKGKMPIRVSDCNLFLDLRVDHGIGVGSLSDTQNIRIENATFDFKASGAIIAGLGSYESSNGTIRIEKSLTAFTATGQEIYVIGAKSGEIDFCVKDSRLNILGEGSMVTGIGTRNLRSKLALLDTDSQVLIRSEKMLLLGAKEEAITIEGGTQSLVGNP